MRAPDIIENMSSGESQRKSQQQRLRMRFLSTVQEIRIERRSLLRQWKVSIDGSNIGANLPSFCCNRDVAALVATAEPCI